MKKILCLITVVCLAFMFVSCSGGCRERYLRLSELPQASVIPGIVWWQIDGIGSRDYFTRSELESITNITVGQIGTGGDEDDVGRGLTGIEMLTNLERITIKTGQIRPNHFRRLRQLPNLRTLWFEGLGIGYFTWGGIELEGIASQIRRFAIVAVPHPEGFSVLESAGVVQIFENLEQLKLSGHNTGVMDNPQSDGIVRGLTNLEGVENLTSLNTLNIFGNRLSNLDELRNLTGLVDLDATHNQLTDISALRNLTNLERVDLSGNRLSEQELRNNLPEHLINREGGEEWLQTQIAGQNFG